jgi:hypothetical protein
LLFNVCYKDYGCEDDDFHPAAVNQSSLHTTNLMQIQEPKAVKMTAGQEAAQ